MKYMVGLPVTPYDGFIERLIQCREHIYEVYFAWSDIPTGRGVAHSSNGLYPWETQTELIRTLEKLAGVGIRLNLLLNAACYGPESQSRQFFYRIGDVIEYVHDRFGLSAITTASPLIARFVHENMAGIDVRASVNMGIGSVQGLEYVADCFDSFYIKRECNRDMKAIRRLLNWCTGHDKRLFMLANSGCLNDCSAHAFHDNLVAHEHEAERYDNAYQFRGVCKDYLAKTDNWVSLLRDTSFVRPEDIRSYEGMFEAVKLATRVNPNPTRLLNAYLEGRFGGNLLSLLEPDYSELLYPHILANGNIPPDFLLRSRESDYCRAVMEHALIELEMA